MYKVVATEPYFEISNVISYLKCIRTIYVFPTFHFLRFLEYCAPFENNWRWVKNVTANPFLAHGVTMQNLASFSHHHSSSSAMRSSRSWPNSDTSQRGSLSRKEYLLSRTLTSYPFRLGKMSFSFIQSYLLWSDISLDIAIYIFHFNSVEIF